MILEGTYSAVRHLLSDNNGILIENSLYQSLILLFIKKRINKTFC